MTEDGCYSMIVRPPEEVCRHVRELVKRTSNRPIPQNPHMSVGSSFYSDDPDFIRKTGEWIEAQKPFKFTLEDIRNFGKSLIYLTSKSDEEIRHFMQLQNGVRNLFEADFIHKNFTPHMTLVKSASRSQTEIIETAMAEMIDNPWQMMIQKVEIQVKTSHRWKTLESFIMGDRSSQEGFKEISVEEYNFSMNGRASTRPN